jgi:hypothetical protein
MANDDESVYRAARTAAARAQKKLDQARTAVGSASTEFGGGVGLSWGSIGDKLNRRKACAAHYKELQSAIGDAGDAIARAKAACDALTRATQQ